MSDDWIQYWFPLVGLGLPGPQAWLHGCLLMQPSYADWRRIERTDVADLRQYETMREALGVEVSNTLPVCIVIGADPNDAPQEMPIHALWPAARRVADCILYGLWLHKAGNILPPELFGLYIDTSDGTVSREPGWYREELPDDIGDGYRLAAEDIPEVEAIATLVGRYRSEAANASADLALENLRASYGWHASPVDRLIVLYAGLEAMLGGYHARDEPFAHVPLPKRAAIATGARETEEFLAGRGRRLRNAVAHGTRLDGDEPRPQEIELLRRVLRLALVRYLAFCLEEHDGGQPPMTRFNTMLAASA
jgi:hypothetical protein